MGDICPCVKKEVIIQSNGIIRLSDSGKLIGRLVEGVTYESLKESQAEQLKRNREMCLKCIFCKPEEGMCEIGFIGDDIINFWNGKINSIICRGFCKIPREVKE